MNTIDKLIVENPGLFFLLIYALGVLLSLIGIVFWNKRYPYNTIPPIVSMFSWITFLYFMLGILMRMLDKITDDDY